MHASLMIAIILLICTPAFYVFAGISMYKRQWKQAFNELTIGVVCTALFLSAVAHYGK